MPERLARLKTAIETRAFVRADERDIVKRGGKRVKDSGWLFDIRDIILDPAVLDDVAALFWHEYGGRTELQIGGIETAAIPFVTALVAHAQKYAPQTRVSGFFIRKSRKKDGLMNMVEGRLSDAPIVLVDDLINSGKSFIRQVEVLAELGKNVEAAWSLIRFRDESYYGYFDERGIAIRAVFSLNDFRNALGVENLEERDEPHGTTAPWRVLWKFSAGSPSYFHVVPKSDPAIDNERLYVGSDDGTFYAIRQSDGAIEWSYKTAWHPKGKGIFSSPAVHEGTVYFGAYDGCVYALDAATGALRWRYAEADWVGSSPAIAAELGVLFIGLEFGLFRKRGGIAALDLKTGKLKWAHRMQSFTHSSPLYIGEHKQVVIGSNDGAVYLFNAQDGSLIWKHEMGSPTQAELDSGFSAFDIKESFAYDPKRDFVMFGNSAGVFAILRRSDGSEVFSFQAEFAFYNTPAIFENLVCIASLDKHLYCFDLDTLAHAWRWNAGARIFASPAVIGSSLFIGANTGRLTELDPRSGLPLTYLVLPERITNRPAYNKKTGRFFIPTFANEIYCAVKQ